MFIINYVYESKNHCRPIFPFHSGPFSPRLRLFRLHWEGKREEHPVGCEPSPGKKGQEDWCPWIACGHCYNFVHGTNLPLSHEVPKTIWQEDWRWTGYQTEKEGHLQLHYRGTFHQQPEAFFQSKQISFIQGTGHNVGCELSPGRNGQEEWGPWTVYWHCYKLSPPSKKKAEDWQATRLNSRDIYSSYKESFHQQLETLFPSKQKSYIYTRNWCLKWTLFSSITPLQTPLGMGQREGHAVGCEQPPGKKGQEDWSPWQLGDIATTLSIALIYYYPIRCPKPSGRKTEDGQATRLKIYSSTTEEPSASNLRHSSGTRKGALYKELDIMSALNRLQGGKAKKSEALGQPMDITTTEQRSTNNLRWSSRASKEAL